MIPMATDPADRAAWAAPTASRLGVSMAFGIAVGIALAVGGQVERRGGIGEERGCRYPARSATREVWEQHARMMQEANQKDEASKEKVANAAQK